MKTSEKFETIGSRRFHELLPGDKFAAVIYDVKPKEVTIRLECGTLHTARSMVLPEARIGELSVFAVRENDFEGRILLEMVKPDPGIKQENMIREALLNAGLSITLENLTLGANLLASGLPVDANSLKRGIFRAPHREYYRMGFKKNPVDLHVFKKRKDGLISVSALVAVETSTLGRVEVFVRDSNLGPVLEIGCDTARNLDIISSHSFKLTEALKLRGISVPSMSFKKIASPFALTSPFPDGLKDHAKQDMTPKRFTFDMRV